MKLSKLKWKNMTSIASLSAAIFLYSCGNDNTSGTNSTTSMTDTTTSNGGATVTNTDTGSLHSGNTSTGTKRKGKISVAIAPAKNTGKMVTDNTGYYNYAEVTPVYKGGQGAIEGYITNNIQYPEDAIANNIEGTVNVEFGIDENGNISGVKTLGTKLGYGLEEEAIKIISGMPAWTPGTVKGKNVKTRMILPITYRLEE